MTQTVKNLPAMWEARMRAPGREDTLEKELATRSSVLVRRIPWIEESGGLQSTKGSDTTERLTHTHKANTSLENTCGPFLSLPTCSIRHLCRRPERKCGELEKTTFFGNSENTVFLDQTEPT